LGTYLANEDHDKCEQHRHQERDLQDDPVQVALVRRVEHHIRVAEEQSREGADQGEQQRKGDDVEEEVPA
jgi:hypothetical protein